MKFAKFFRFRRHFRVDSEVRDHLPSFIIFCSEEIQRTPLLTINCKMLRKNCGSWNFTVDFTGFLEYFPIETAIAFRPGRVNAGGADAPACKVTDFLIAPMKKKVCPVVVMHAC
ncbi:uncharacterized protein ACIBXB_003654 isoform 2-T2 [Morphnus guianensis]